MVLSEMKFDHKMQEEWSELEIHKFYRNLIESKEDVIESESEPESSDQE